MARGDSFVVETKVHFPADTIQLFDSIRKVIELCARLSDQQGSSEDSVTLYSKRKRVSARTPVRCSVATNTPGKTWETSVNSGS
jgi:hypothetical protein